jgi:leucyl aminopeptidase
MKLSFQKTSLNRTKADLVAVFIHQDEQIFKRQIAELSRRFASRLAPADNGDFKGKEGETSLVYLEKGSAVHRILLVGLGEKKKLSLERYRRAAATASKRGRTLKAKRIALFLPPMDRRASDVITAMAEAAYLSLYKFEKYLSKKNDDGDASVEEVTLCTDTSAFLKLGETSVRTAQIIAEATCLARDLANAPGNEIYPETLAQAARESADRCGFSVTVLDEREIKELGMGGVIGVSQGSVHPPRFLILEYGRPLKKAVVLVGKGVTFDTGGISLKPSANMSEMKMDMSGAAAVIGTFEAVARLRLPVHLVGLVPAVENMPGGGSIRPGDILRHYNGKTSEVDNTDAEGRLILADALAYAEKYHPAAVIDLATLTGACVVALGHHATGMMGNNSELMQRLRSAGEKTYERVWELPLFDEYEKLIKSDIADVKNAGGRWAGAITAGWFLKKFIGDYKWAHLDIAGTAILEENTDYTSKGGSGVGVRLLTEFLREWK